MGRPAPAPWVVRVRRLVVMVFWIVLLGAAFAGNADLVVTVARLGLLFMVFGGLVHAARWLLARRPISGTSLDALDARERYIDHVDIAPCCATFRGALRCPERKALQQESREAARRAADALRHGVAF